MDVKPELKAISDCLYRVSGKAIIIRGGAILMVKEKDPENWYSLPGGGIDYGENIETALLRELEEELGLAAADITVQPGVQFITHHEIYHGIPRIQIYYLAHLSDTVDYGTLGKELSYNWFQAIELATAPLNPSTAEAVPHLLRILEPESS
jgi:8-oxo-dGTP pyrophosphatase MutT (NUDIX family)